MDSFARLFLAPGTAHCASGAGPAPADPVAAAVNWVEHGQASTQPGAAKALAEAAARAISAVASFPVPSLARIEGVCIGGGCSLAPACDLRFATPGSIFGIPAVRHGLVYDEGSLARLAELIGPRHPPT